MADKSHIEWTDATWNPITGCTVVSEGCRNCYAMQLAGTRLKDHPSRDGLTRQNAAGHHIWTGEVRFNGQWLDQPLRWRKPRMVFVCAHGDLFHEAVPDEWINRVFAVMALAPQHIFQVLTKRPQRMHQWFGPQPVEPTRRNRVALAMSRQLGRDVLHLPEWPLPNVWLGTSIEDQKTADERIPQLLATPAAIRWISAEPLLGPVNLAALDIGGNVHVNALRGERIDWGDPDDGILPPDITDIARLNWVVVGGESGAGARPMHPDWARSLRDQCASAPQRSVAGAPQETARVPFFFKQWGEWLPWQGGVGMPWTSQAMDEIPPGLDLSEAEGPNVWRSGSDCSQEFQRVGKARAGRLLDGAEHNAMPRLHGEEAGTAVSNHGGGR